MMAAARVRHGEHAQMRESCDVSAENESGIALISRKVVCRVGLFCRMVCKCHFPYIGQILEHKRIVRIRLSSPFSPYDTLLISTMLLSCPLVSASRHSFSKRADFEPD